MSSQPDKSSRRLRMSADPSDATPTRIVLGDDPALFESRSSTTTAAQLGLTPAQMEAANQRVTQALRRGSSAAVVLNEDRTIISKRTPGDHAPPPIHVGPLESRKALEGQTVEHFEIQEYVGGGGMGAVYRGLDTRLNRAVAVKVLSRDQSDAETVRRFHNEAQSAARLDHPYISRVYYIGEDKGWNFIVFEFIEGVNLRNRVETNGPLPLDEAISYTLQIAEALDHAQARDVVHRDIKPSNVLVTGDGTIKLVDMGLARLHQVNAENEDLTASGVTLGTFDYISPEQARDPRTADVRSDIYSLGCTLYFMLAGRPPFPEGTALQKLLWHTGDDPPDVRLFRPETPDEIVSLMARMMAKRPEQRFQTAKDLIAALVHVSRHQGYAMDGSSHSRVFSPWPEVAVNSVAPWWQQYTPLLVAALLLAVVGLWPEAERPRAALERLTQLPPAHAAVPVATSEVPRAVGNSPATTAPNNAPSEKTPEKNKGDIAANATGVSGSPAEVPPTPKKTEPMPGEEVTAVTPSVNNSGSGNATPTPMPDRVKPVPAAVIHTVVVKPVADEAAALPGTLQVETIGEAFRHASMHPETTVIEFAFNGSQIIARPLEIASRRLTLRAASGYSPELVFRPSPDDDHRTCFRLPATEAALTLEGLRLRAEIPVSSNEWSVFQLPGEGALELSQCVVTTVNASNGFRHAPLVAVFDCLANDLLSSSTEKIDESVESPTSRLVVKQSILRGDAVICRVVQDRPVRLTMNDSFVATAGHLLETGGGGTKPRWMDRIRVSLHHCTLAADAGLILSGAQIHQPHRMEVRVDMENCVTATARSHALIEYRGGDSGDEGRLTFEGSGNFYPRTNVFFRRVLLQDGQETVYDTPLGELPRWARDRNPEQGAFASIPADIPSHELGPAEFVLKAPDEQAAGCNAAHLPAVEAAIRRPIKNATNMSSVNGDMPSTVAPPMMDEKSTPRSMP